MMQLVIILFLLLLAGFFNALMDTSSEGEFEHDWWNKETGAKLKWKNGDPSQGEKFWLSSTALVFLTDGWHLCQFFFHSCWQLSIAVAIGDDYLVWWFLGIKLAFSSCFQMFYDMVNPKL